MKSSSIRLVVILGAIAISGILLMQIWLFRMNWNSAEKEFHQTVSIALLNVAKSMAEYSGTILPSSGLIKRVSSNYYVVNFNDIINANLLEYYLLEEFGNLGVHTNFEYAIYDCGSDEMLYGNYCNVEDPEFSASTDQRLPQYDEFIYYFGVKFPTQRLFLFADIKLTIIFSFVTIIALVFFSYAIYVMLRQKRLSEFQRDFINNMTHEFKTPISSIKVSSDVLLGSPNVSENERLTKYATIIKQQNERLNQHVEKVLSIAKLDDSQFRLNLEEVDLNEKIRTIVANKELEMRQSGVHVNLDLTDTALIIQADKLHLANVIYNLLDNAIKYRKNDPEITIATRQKGNRISMSIKDNGIGIADEHHRDLFKKFFRVPTGNVHDVKGFGLGLHYCKRIVDQHKWQIHVKSEPNKGTEMEIVF
ncbi:MAG: sensor histidine kinase [Bacteroidetes bacterium]|nr:MAG: sensor histidine kinase [Bacteroidota bacterium]